MGAKVGRGQRRTLPAGLTEFLAADEGFTLLEIVCVVAIVAMLAAIVLPAISRGTSQARLEAYAIETARLLKEDRNAAIRRRVQVATAVDPMSRLVRSGATGRVVHIPDDVAVDVASEPIKRGRGFGDQARKGEQQTVLLNHVMHTIASDLPLVNNTSGANTTCFLPITQ